MTLFVGGPAHGRDVEVAPVNRVEWPRPRARADLVAPQDLQPLRPVTYVRRRLATTDEDGRGYWSRDVYVLENLGDWSYRESLKELLFSRFIREGVRVDL